MITPQGLKKYLYTLSFIEGFCVLAIQIGGTRLLAPAFGTSIFVWTSQISITLIALAVGYIIAGKLTERFNPIRMLSMTLTMATAWLASLPFLKAPLLTPLLILDSRLGVLLGAAFLFGLPLLLLGGTGPIIIKALVEKVHESGKIAGRVFGISTFGSVAGALYLGFFGLGIHTVNQIIWGLAGLVGFCSVIPLLILKNPIPLLLLLIPLLASSIPKKESEIQSWRILETRPSAYGEITVLDVTSNDRVFRCLFNDGLQQNCISHYPKEKQMAGLFHTNRIAILAEVFGETGGETLVIGSAAGVLPMYFTNRGAQVDIIEINPAMLPIAKKYFGFNPALMRSITIEDGRSAVRKIDKMYDLIVLNAFIGDSFPAHLVTQESFQNLAKRLKKSGVVLTNLMGTLGTKKGGKSLNAIQSTFQRVFRYNRFFSTKAIRKKPANIFVVSSNFNFKQTKKLFEIPYPRVTKSDLEALSFIIPSFQGKSIFLTDAFNPIEHWDAETRQTLRKNIIQQTQSPNLFLF